MTIDNSIAQQMDRCDVCGNKIHRRKLVRTQVEYVIPQGENYLEYSSYNSAFWTVDTSVDAGLISYGNRCDHARTQVPPDQPTAAGAMTIVNGVQTWTGSGVYRMNTLTPSFSATNSKMTFSAVIAPHMLNESPSMVVKLGVCNSDGSVLQPIKTWNIRTMKRVWFAEYKQTLEDYGLGGGNYDQYYYIEVTNAGDWWVDEAQLEVGTVTGAPETFVPTTGTYQSSAVESTGIATRKVCPNCFEGVFRKSERFGRSDEPQIDYPVTNHVQEF